MPGNNPMFSICIPAHNPFPYLQQALDSVVSQTFADWEVVIVDDCSEFEVRSELGRCGVLADGRIKCIRLSENKGPFYARKIAFGACSGVYVLCLDADDELLGPYVLEELYQAIRSAEVGPDVVMFNAVTSLSGRKPWVDYGSFGFCEGSLCRGSVIRCFLETHRLNNLWLKAINRECVLPISLDAAAGLYMNEDRLEVAEVLLKARTFLLLDKPLYYYRQNPSSTTHRKFELDYCRQQSVVEKAVASMFSAEFSSAGPHRMILDGWVYDMCRITWGRSIAESVACFKVMADNPFYKEACESMGIRGLRTHRRVLLWLLNTGRFTFAVIAANALRVLTDLLEKRLR